MTVEMHPKGICYVSMACILSATKPDSFGLWIQMLDIKGHSRAVHTKGIGTLQR